MSAMPMMLLLLAITGRVDLHTPPGVQELLLETGHVDRAFTRATARNGRALRALELVRAQCCEQERETTTVELPGGSSAWSTAWEATEPSRLALKQQARGVGEQWYDMLESVVQADSVSTLEDEARQAVAGACVAVLEAWVKLEEPSTTLEGLPEQFPALATAVGWGSEPAIRQAFLATVADRLAVTPGISDLDLLCEIIGWEDLLLGGAPSTEEKLELLTTDLVLVFTERSSNGISLSRAGFYRGGRCGDTGFHETLRDGSDQVRHLCWAMRMFAIASDPAQAEQLLRLREVRDARARGQAVNEADIKLNRAARELLEEMREVETLSDLFESKLGNRA